VHRHNEPVEVFDEPFWKVGADFAELGLESWQILALLVELCEVSR
jgi:hypothetical protein